MEDPWNQDEEIRSNIESRMVLYEAEYRVEGYAVASTDWNSRYYSIDSPPWHREMRGVFKQWHLNCERDSSKTPVEFDPDDSIESILHKVHAELKFPLGKIKFSPSFSDRATLVRSAIENAIKSIESGHKSFVEASPYDFMFFESKFAILWSDMIQFESVNIHLSTRISGFILDGQHRVLVILHSRETSGSPPFQNDWFTAIPSLSDR
jgi:hypothetical protein